MFQQKNSILTNEHALNHEHVPLRNDDGDDNENGKKAIGLY